MRKQKYFKITEAEKITLIELLKKIYNKEKFTVCNLEDTYYLLNKLIGINYEK